MGQKWTLGTLEIRDIRNGTRNVGSIADLGGTTLRRHFFHKKRGHFLKIKRPLLCLLQNLGGHMPLVHPVPTSINGTVEA